MQHSERAVTLYSPIPGIEIEHTEVKGVPALMITIGERHLASWSEWMATQVQLYFYPEDDDEDPEFDDGELDIGVELEEE